MNNEKSVNVLEVLQKIPRLKPNTVEEYCKRNEWTKTKFYSVYNRKRKKTIEDMQHIAEIIKLDRELNADIIRQEQEAVKTLANTLQELGIA